METKLQKKTKRDSYIVQTSFLLEATQQLCHTYQTEYTVKHIRIECIDQIYIKENFYSANNMKKLFQNTEIKKVISFLKAINM